MAVGDYHRRRMAQDLTDPEFREAYEETRAEIAQVDGVMRTLDHLRESAGMTKADLARQIGKDPAAVRRLLTAGAPNPEISTVAAMARVLGAEIRVVVPEAV